MLLLWVQEVEEDRPESRPESRTSEGREVDMSVQETKWTSRSLGPESELHTDESEARS